MNTIYTVQTAEDQAFLERVGELPDYEAETGAVARGGAIS